MAPIYMTVMSHRQTNYLSKAAFHDTLLLNNFKHIFRFDTVMDDLKIVWTQDQSKADGSFNKIHLVKVVDARRRLILVVDDDYVKLVELSQNEGKSTALMVVPHYLQEINLFVDAQVMVDEDDVEQAPSIGGLEDIEMLFDQDEKQVELVQQPKRVKLVLMATGLDQASHLLSLQLDLRQAE